MRYAVTKVEDNFADFTQTVHEVIAYGDESKPAFSRKKC